MLLPDLVCAACPPDRRLRGCVPRFRAGRADLDRFHHGERHRGSSYDAYQIFSANVVDGDSDAKFATDLAWASDAVRAAALPVMHSDGMPNSQTTAQEAAEWLNTDSHLTSALSAQLARSLQSSGAVSVALNAGTAAELPCGYWLIVADDDAIAQGEAGTAPIMALVGGSAVTVKPKAATPKVSKHVLEDSVSVGII